jgi:hypothetical protein
MCIVCSKKNITSHQRHLVPFEMMAKHAMCNEISKYLGRWLSILGVISGLLHQRPRSPLHPITTSIDLTSVLYTRESKHQCVS